MNGPAIAGRQSSRRLENLRTVGVGCLLPIAGFLVWMGAVWWWA